MKYPVKWFSSDMDNEPGLSPGTAGSLIQLFDSCLINGFGDRSDISNFVYNDSEKTITITFTNTHKFQKYQIVEISGADQTFYNDEFRISEIIDDNNIKIKLESGRQPSDINPTTSTSFSIKTPGLHNWEKQFTDATGNIAAYRCNLLDSSNCVIRVDHENIIDQESHYHSTFNNYERMTDINTGINEFTHGYNHFRLGKNSTSLVNWFIVADDYMVYFWTPRYSDLKGDYSYNSRSRFHCFGDFISYKKGDSYNYLAVGSRKGQYFHYGSTDFARLNTNIGHIPRDSRNLEQDGNDDFSFRGNSRSGYMGYGGYSSLNPSDNSLHFNEITIRGARLNELRGKLPGCYQLLHGNPHNSPYLEYEKNKIWLEGLYNNPSSLIVLIGCSDRQSSDSLAFAAFDVKGPWR